MKITLNKKARHNLNRGMVKLRPGANEVDPALWAKVKDHQITKALIADGSVVADEPVASEPAAAAPHLRETQQTVMRDGLGVRQGVETSSLIDALAVMSNDEAVSCVRNTGDVGVLRAYLGSESRKPVARAIKERLSELGS